MRGLPDFFKRTFIMGVLNVTPDSFSDGGLYLDPQKAAEHALRMADEGADIIDIGGESTRPGARPVDAETETARVIPVLRAVRKKTSALISIDTSKARVAERAVSEGADIINDISGLRADPAMPAVAAKLNVPVVIMHMKGTPKDMQKNPRYDALIPEILDFLRQSIGIAVKAGVKEDRIIIDPGIGFGKSFDHNIELIKNLDVFTGLGKPIAIGVSRKAFIGHILGGLPPERRLEGTLAAIAIAIANGANILRVHDVAPAVRAARVADAIARAPSLL